jgi:hypothetical protein
MPTTGHCPGVISLLCNFFLLPVSALKPRADNGGRLQNFTANDNSRLERKWVRPEQ